MYEYGCELQRVIDGDTVEVDIDLGFGFWLRGEIVRLNGIDAPESRTRDKVEKFFGLLAKERVQAYFAYRDPDVTAENRVPTFVLISRQFMKGKFGRILADFRTDGVQGQHRALCGTLIQEGYAVPYRGQAKDAVQADHLANRDRLILEGKVSQADLDKLSSKK